MLRPIIKAVLRDGSNEGLRHMFFVENLDGIILNTLSYVGLYHEYRLQCFPCGDETCSF